MPKLKSVKGVKRRFKVTATGKVRVFRSGKRHLLGGKRSKTKRKLRRPAVLSESNRRSILALING
jgi:large subunit ribosomal protein L35